MWLIINKGWLKHGTNTNRDRQERTVNDTQEDDNAQQVKREATIFLK